MLKPLLTANWRYFAMLNFVVDSKILAPRVPAGTDPDFPQRQTYLSVVAFLSITPNLGTLYGDRSRLVENPTRRYNPTGSS